MNEMVRYGVILGVICALAGGLLAGVNAWTKPRIMEQAYAGEQNALRELCPGAVDFQASESENGEVEYYKALDAEGKLLGILFKARGKGYAGMIETMTAMSPDGKIRAVKVMKQNETPGLGSRVQESSFYRNFEGKSIDKISGVQAIAGATISSRAVINSVESRARQVMEMIDK